MKFIVEKPFWDLFPEASFGVLVLDNVNNKEEEYTKNPSIESDLKSANKGAKKYIVTSPISCCPTISVWRAAYAKFKKKKDVRSSMENLLKRVEKDNEVGLINPVVDIYNTISLLYAFPAGAEDIDTFKGNMLLTMTKGGDSFRGIGEDEDDPTLDGEICYIDDIGAVCRCWNWRDGERTKVTNDSKHIFMIIENVDPTRKDELKKATNDLADRVEKVLGAKVLHKEIADIDNRSVELE